MTTETETKPVQTNVSLDAEVRAELERMCKADDRTMSLQVAWLIKQEAARRRADEDDAA